MKIIFQCNSDFAKSGSVGFRTYQIARESINKGHSIKVICRSKTCSEIPDRDILSSSVLYYYFSLFLTGLHKFVSTSIPSWKIRQALFDRLSVRKISKCDIFHTWEYCTQSLKKAKSLGAITILDLQMGYMKHPCLEYVDYIFAPSKYWYHECLKQGVSEDQVFLNPFGVDLKKFVPSKQKRKNVFTALFVGVLEPRKGLRYLLEAWKQLNLPKSELILAGYNSMSMKECLKRYQQCKTIRVLGQVPHDKIVDLYHTADIFVFPSIKEGSAKATYEAMACGLPVITTINAGSIVRHGKDGLIVKAQDSQDLAKKIHALYKNQKKRAQMSKNASMHIQKYSWTKYAARSLQAYKEIWKRENKKC